MGWIGCVRRDKNPTRLRSTIFCTSSARFALSVVWQPNGPKWIQMVRNAPKHEFRVTWGGSGAFFCRKFRRDFVAQTFALVRNVSPRVSQSNQMVANAPKRYETHQNMSLGSNGVDRVHSLQKIPTRLRGTNFCTSSERFTQSFARQPNGRKCTKMVRNVPKHEFRVQWGRLVAFVAKKIRLDFVARTFALVRPVLPRV